MYATIAEEHAALRRQMFGVSPVLTAQEADFLRTLLGDTVQLAKDSAEDGELEPGTLDTLALARGILGKL